MRYHQRIIEPLNRAAFETQAGATTRVENAICADEGYLRHESQGPLWALCSWRSHGTKIAILESKLRSGTSKTKQLYNFLCFKCRSA